MSGPEFIDGYVQAVADIASSLDINAIQGMAACLASVRQRHGRLFLIGVGGSAANCSHAVNDFRKLCGIECYSPCDNVAELTARTNDDGWETVFVEWLKVSRLGNYDALLVLSVGGGAQKISANISRAVEYAKAEGAMVLGIVGPHGGATGALGDHVLKIKCETLMTPLVESFQSVVWHCLVNHPLLLRS